MNSFISWIGGKRLLRKQIIEQFPEKIKYERYVEVFGGAGWVFFQKEKHAELEVYNDINGELVNLFRCVKYHAEALQKELEWTLMSREQFVTLKNMNGKTDIQRAARFFILIKESFGANCKSFGLKSRDIHKSVEFLKEIALRLNKVIIENLDFQHLLKIYDRDNTMFYLDPPYYLAEKYYPDKFNTDDHLRLYDCLTKIEGLFILSYNSCPEIKELYKNFNIIEVSRFDNLASKSGGQEYKELIIKNF